MAKWSMHAAKTSVARLSCKRLESFGVKIMATPSKSEVEVSPYAIGYYASTLARIKHAIGKLGV